MTIWLTSGHPTKAVSICPTTGLLCHATAMRRHALDLCQTDGRAGRARACERARTLV